MQMTGIHQRKSHPIRRQGSGKRKSDKAYCTKHSSMLTQTYVEINFHFSVLLNATRSAIAFALWGNRAVFAFFSIFPFRGFKMKPNSE